MSKAKAGAYRGKLDRGMKGDLPHFNDSNGVWAAIAVSQKGVCAVYEFSSEREGCGHAETALRHLKATYGEIVVIDAGEIDEDGVKDVSLGFWLHMLSKGVVSEVNEDDGGARHTLVGGKVVRQTADELDAARAVA